MKKCLISLTVALLAAGSLLAQDFEYPFQNPQLSDDERIDNVLSLMTLQEKTTLFGSAGIPRLGIANPGSAEAIHGAVMSGNPSSSARRENYSTAFPQGYGLGETWDKGVLRSVGETMATEVRYYHSQGRNALVLWAPNADLARDPRWGRTEESLGEDAFLVGTLGAEMIKGMQGPDPKYWGAASLMKHFLANSNEDGRIYTSSDFSKKLFYEYYSYGFYKGVQAGAGSLMLAYNAWNGVPCTCNEYIFDVLINKWGMKGQLATDAGGYRNIVGAHKYMDDLVEAAAACVKCGIGRFLDPFQPYVDQALEKGLITEADVDKAIRGNIFNMLKLGLLDAPGTINPYSHIGAEGAPAPWLTDEMKARSLEAARKSVVLLKNDAQTLPVSLDKVTKIAVFGNRAESVIQDWYGAKPSYTVTALQGIKNAVEGKNIEVKYMDLDHDGDAERLAEWADVCIVVVGNHPVTSSDWEIAPWGKGSRLSEGREAVDRQSLELDSEDLIKLVHRSNPNTVVALLSSFPYAINWTAENVPAIVHMTQCSQDLGTALADVIFGKYNPAGRTSQTWVKSILDLPNMLDYDIANGRTYMYFKGEPLFAFGYGLSYTTFKYSNLVLEAAGDGGMMVKVDVENVGAVDGEEVVQLYLKFEGDDAAKRLKGFERVAVAAGQKLTVELPVCKTDLSLWDEAADDWAVAAGKAEVQVGASSDDIRVRGNAILDDAGFVKAGSRCCAGLVAGIIAAILVLGAVLFFRRKK